MVRQLTAIMFTDIVGFTVLMQEDEQQARRSRDPHNEFFSDGITEEIINALTRVTHVLEGSFHRGHLRRPGRDREAREQIDRTLELHPRFRSTIETSGWIHVRQGDYAAALADFERLPTEAGHSYAGIADRGNAYGRLGRVEDAHAMIALLSERQQRQPGMEVYHRVVEVDLLSRAIDRHVGGVVLLDSFSAFAPAHSDPRFQALLDRTGIRRAVAA